MAIFEKRASPQWQSYLKKGNAQTSIMSLEKLEFPKGFIVSNFNNDNNMYIATQGHVR